MPSLSATFLGDTRNLDAAYAKAATGAKSASNAIATGMNTTAAALERQILLAQREGKSYTEAAAALAILNKERMAFQLNRPGTASPYGVSGNAAAKQAAIDSGAVVDLSMLGQYKARRLAHAADEAEIARYEEALRTGGTRTVAALGSANAAEEAIWATKYAEAKARVAARKTLEKEGVDWALTQKAVQGAMWSEQNIAAGAMLANFEKQRIAAAALEAEELAILETRVASAAAGKMSGGGHGPGGLTGIIRESLVIMREVSMGRGIGRIGGSVTLLAQYLGVLKFAVKSTATESMLAAKAARELSIAMDVQALRAKGTAAFIELESAAKAQNVIATEAETVANYELLTAKVALNAAFFIGIGLIVAAGAAAFFLWRHFKKAAEEAKNLADALNPLNKKMSELADARTDAAKANQEYLDWKKDLLDMHKSESDAIERKIKLLKEEAKARGATDTETLAMEKQMLETEKARLEGEVKKSVADADAAQKNDTATGTDFSTGKAITAKQAADKLKLLGEIADAAQIAEDKAASGGLKLDPRSPFGVGIKDGKSGTILTFKAGEKEYRMTLDEATKNLLKASQQSEKLAADQKALDDILKDAKATAAEKQAAYVKVQNDLQDIGDEQKFQKGGKVEMDLTANQRIGAFAMPMQTTMIDIARQQVARQDMTNTLLQKIGTVLSKNGHGSMVQDFSKIINGPFGG